MASRAIAFIGWSDEREGSYVTISTDVAAKTIVCDGSSTAFSLAGLIYFATTDLSVQKVVDGVATDLTLGTHYTLTGTGETGAGVLTTASVFASGVKIFVLRGTADVQQQQYPEGGGFPSADTERAFDRRTLRSQEQNRAVLRCLRVPPHETGIDVLPVAAARAGKVLAFGSDGRPLLVGDYSTVESLQDAIDSTTASAAAAASSAEDAGTSATSAKYDADVSKAISVTGCPQLTPAMLPHLTAALREKWHPATVGGAVQKIRIAGCGDSTDAGAGASQTPVDALCAALQAEIDPEKKLYEFEAVNLAVGGTVYDQWVSTASNGHWNDIVAAHAESPLSAVLMGCTMNTASPNGFNTGATFPISRASVVTFAEKCKALGVDVIEFIPPQCNTERYDHTLNAVLSVVYPFSSYDFTDTFTFSGNKVTAATAGAFLESAGHGVFLTAGREITVASGANAGKYTIYAVDSAGTYLTITGTFPSSSAYSCQIKRTSIQQSEQYPDASNSVIEVDVLGTGTAVKFDTRFTLFNNVKRAVASAANTAHAILDATLWWALAAQSGQDRLFDGPTENQVHWNDVMYTEVIIPACQAFARSVSSVCYGAAKGGVPVPEYLQSVCIRGDRSEVDTDDLSRTGALDVQPSATDTYIAVYRDTDGDIVSGRYLDGRQTERFGSKDVVIKRGRTYQNSTTDAVTFAITTRQFVIRAWCRTGSFGMYDVQVCGGIAVSGTALSYTATVNHVEIPATPPVTISASGLTLSITPTVPGCYIAWEWTAIPDEG